MDPEDSLPQSQNDVTRPHSEAKEFSLHPTPLRFNLMLSSYLCLGFPRSLLSSEGRIEILQARLTSPKRIYISHPTNSP